MPRGWAQAKSTRSLRDSSLPSVEAHTASGRITTTSAAMNSGACHPIAADIAPRMLTFDASTMNSIPINRTLRFSLNSITCFSVTTRWFAKITPNSVTVTKPDSRCK